MNISDVWPEWNEDCVLGEGSFGKVYRAKRMEYGRTFYSAIKVITVPKNQQEVKFARAQGMNDQEIYNYFRGLVDNLFNEITLMDNIKGAKNIVGIEDYKIIEKEGEIGWDVFIRMELLTPFDSFISNPDFSQKDVIRLGVDICTALEICEQNYIVHRDIKPDNIFISRFGEYKLGDFGIARKLEATQANLSRKGTLNYMAPEVYKSEEYGSNVDIYSLGLVLYTLLNNNRIAFLPPYPQPISYKDNEEALAKRLSGMPLTLPCNASVSLGEAIEKACAFRPQDRYQSATEFKNALIAEWNILVQSGDNQEISSDAMRFSGNMAQRFQNTTNDMTANGRLVIDEYAQGTTVLGQENYASDGYADGYGYGGAYNGYNYGEGVSSQVLYPSGKSSKVCRVIAWPMAVLVCILALVQFFGGLQYVSDQAFFIAMMGIGVTVLIADRNKYAVGMSVFALSLPHIFQGAGSILEGMQTDQFPVEAAVVLISGLLLLSAGIVLLSQKEVRFGGALCVYAVAVEWLYQIYQMIDAHFSMDIWHIFYSVTALTVFIWAYGYQSNTKTYGVRKVMHIVAYVLGGLVTSQAVIFAIVSIMAMIDLKG